MIKIKVAPYGITAEGHAGYDEPGKDIVCAAVSVLLQALALGLERERNHGGLASMMVEFESGAARICAMPHSDSEYVREVRLLFDVFAEALLRIAQDYPEYVEVQPLEGASV